MNEWIMRNSLVIVLAVAKFEALLPSLSTIAAAQTNKPGSLTLLASVSKAVTTKEGCAADPF